MSEARVEAAKLRRIAAELLDLASQLEGQPIPSTHRDRSLTALAKAALRARKERERFFPPKLFVEPAWDMLLDLYAAPAPSHALRTTSLCHGSGVAPTTALRYVDLIVTLGLAERREDPNDARLVLISLSTRGRDAMDAYLRSLGEERYGPAVEQTLIAT